MSLRSASVQLNFAGEDDADFYVTVSHYENSKPTVLIQSLEQASLSFEDFDAITKAVEIVRGASRGRT